MAKRDGFDKNWQVGTLILWQREYYDGYADQVAIGLAHRWNNAVYDFLYIQIGRSFYRAFSIGLDGGWYISLFGLELGNDDMAFYVGFRDWSHDIWRNKPLPEDGVDSDGEAR